jgi:hypothetical protein
MKPSTTAFRAAQAVLGASFEAVAVATALAELRGRPVTHALTALAARLVGSFRPGSRPQLREVAAALDQSKAFARLFPRLPPPAMRPAAGAPQAWSLPPLTTVIELAGWLGISPGALQHLSAPWRADEEAPAPMSHYRYRWLARPGRLPRLIEAPLPRLKAVQRKILGGILAAIPPHPAAHGFVRGRGIVGFATPHAGQRCVLRMDIADFFPTIRRARVYRIFLTAGYPDEVAAALANCCTAATPAAIRREGLAAHPPAAAWPVRQRLKERHLPQGAPTSPALANLVAFALDQRLAGLARQFGATYTRYADDLLFSGGDAFRRDAKRCEMLAGAILLEEGFTPAWRKTRLMPNSVSQRAAGLILNDQPRLPRAERDILKAILTNCLRHGPDSQNRSGHPEFRAHLLGRIAHACHIHPASGEKLRALFNRIPWNAFGVSPR